MKVGETRPARRLPDGSKEFAEADYCLFANRDSAWVWPPGARSVGRIATAQGFKFEEHEDGTVTVVGSILFKEGASDGSDWHGYLQRGVWSRV